MKQIGRKIAVVALALCLALWPTWPARAAGWDPAPQEVFANAGLQVLDGSRGAVATMMRIESEPMTLSFSLVPEFYDADGRLLATIDYSARESLLAKYTANGGSEDGFGLWLVNKYNDYRGFARVTAADVDAFHARRASEGQAQAAARDARARTDLGSLTHEELFAGITVTVLDHTRPAMSIGAFEWPMERMNFLDAEGNVLGYVSGDDYLTVMERAQYHYETVLNHMPGGSAIYYAQCFNDHRGVRRATIDEYLSANNLRAERFDAEQWAGLEEIFGKGARDSYTVRGGTGTTTIYVGNTAYTFTDASGWASDVVRLTNGERAAQGLPALSEDAELMALAQTRARELAESMSHTRPNGQSASSWVMEQTGRRGAGENIAAGQTSPQHAVSCWMDSTGHRANILRDGYTAMGAGYYQDPDSGVAYWVQLFGY